MEIATQQNLSKRYILIKSYYIILVFLLSSCSSFDNNDEVLIARLGDSYLYEHQLNNQFGVGLARMARTIRERMNVRHKIKSRPQHLFHRS